MKTTWILIANSSQARIFTAAKNIKSMRLLQEFFHPESREKVTNLVTGGGGRYRNAGAMPGGIMQEPTDPKQVEIEKFAHTLAQKLEEGRTKNLYENLILIAPSQFQGLLNKHCNAHIKNKIINTLDKDYTKLTEHQLPKYLDGKLTFRYAA